MTEPNRIRTWAPGRVNLIGDHTDYTGGLCLPIALDLGTTVDGVRTGDRVRLSSALDDTTTDLSLDGSTTATGWARYIAAVIDEVGPDVGFEGTITTTLPVGAGLSSSASLEVAVALALGFDGSLLELAQAAQRAEHAAVGVPCGVMDQIASVFGREGHALLIDCRNLEVLPVPFPEGADLVVLNPGESRQLAGSAYAERRAACETAETQIGPLRDATQDDLAEVRDPIVRKRARHVVSENERVMTVAKALRRADWATIGEAMFASHRSLRDDFEVSTPALDALVDNLSETPGVYGARLTGAGFGGCVVAITEPGALPFTTPVRPSRGARIA
jgi:galactokinase